MAQGKHVVLKDQTLVMTEELYQKIRVAEEATHERRCSMGHRRNRRLPHAALVSANDVQDIQEENQAIIGDLIKVLGS